MEKDNISQSATNIPDPDPKPTASSQCATNIPHPPEPELEGTKKRKGTNTRSQVWDHFEKIFNSDGELKKGKCLYCGKMYAAEVKKHGTSTLNTHMKACLKNPHSKETKQSSLQVKNVKNENTEGVLTTWMFNQEVIRRALANMIIMDELPFRLVEGKGFKQFIDAACPRFKIPSRWTINRDIFGIFFEEKTNLKKSFKQNTQRASLTTDTWTSVQMINYMCITAHFIDDQWKLNKKIISFVPIYSHKGESIAKALEGCLLDWGIKNIFTITVDNASSNDVAIGFLKSKLLAWGCSSIKAEYMHMRCIAHILNLVVQDGLKFADASIKRIRDCVRWVRSSPARLKKFKELAELIGVEAKSSLCLDVPTRWNSTYLMLQRALTYRKVFEAYEGDDSSFFSDLGDSMPSYLDWTYVESLVPILKSFYEMTVRISGSLYVTCNTFLTEISDLSCILADMMQGESESSKVMGRKMKEKFDKCWGVQANMNLIIFFANILDPRDKVEYMPIQFNQLYGEEQGTLLFDKVKSSLTILFEDYVATYAKPSTVKPSPAVECENVPIGRAPSRLKSQLKKQKMESGVSSKTELDVYLSEAIIEDDVDFDILRWWKANSDRFPILSKIARDMFAVPISTVASESTFSTSGRVLDNFRSSLTPKIVEALICAQDWLRGPSQPIAIEENIDKVENFEKELINVRSGQSGGSSCTPRIDEEDLVNLEAK